MAHPDDAEFVCAGTIARWVDEGHDVVYVLITSGDKGSDDPEMTPQRLAATREAEQRDAAREVFDRCIEAVKTMPSYRYREHRKWDKLAREQLKKPQITQITQTRSA